MALTVCLALLDIEDSFELVKEGLDKTGNAEVAAAKYKELKQRIDDELEGPGLNMFGFDTY